MPDSQRSLPHRARSVNEANTFAKQTGQRWKGKPKLTRYGARAGRWQLIWWSRWIGIRNIGHWPESQPRQPIYSVRIALGLLELRRFGA